MTTLRRRWREFRARSDDSGASSGFYLVFGVAALLIIGLVIDGGQQVRGMGDAERVATEAARAGLQVCQIDGCSSPQSAITAAQQYVAKADQDGRMASTITVEGTRLHVQVTVTVTTAFLGLAGIDTLRATGNGTAQLVLTKGGAP